MANAHGPSLVPVGVAGVGKTTQHRVAVRHEARLLLASRPSLYLLLRGSQWAGPIRWMPRLGWIVSDPVLSREILNDPAHFTLLGEGGVGHLWAQVLGDYVYRLFDGPGHADLRTRSRDLFTERSAHDLVGRVLGPSLSQVTNDLPRGGTVDVADLSRVLVGRMVADMLGLGGAGEADDEWFRGVFASGERLAALALGSAASTELAPATVEAARAIVDELTANVPSAYRSAPATTLLGRCRELGLTLEETRGLASLLMVAGTETAATAMTRTVALLHDTGQTSRLLTAPELLPGAVREGLRVTTPAPLIGRHVTSPVAVGGKQLRAGERVLLLTYVANTAAGPFDIAAPYLPANRQLWFGAGRHLCLGAPVARAEMTQLLQALLACGRPWQVVDRRYARKVMIPSYASLKIRLTPLTALPPHTHHQ